MYPVNMERLTLGDVNQNLIGLLDSFACVKELHRLFPNVLWIEHLSDQSLMERSLGEASVAGHTSAFSTDNLHLH